MYSYQVNCAQRITFTESLRGIHYPYIISTREDAYFFNPMDFAHLIHTFNQRQCNIMTKDCLSWGGLNMRFQLLDHDSAIAFLSQRLSFYQ